MERVYIGKRREPLTVILLSVVTCGIYAIWYYYQLMEDMNRARGTKVFDSMLLTILCIVVAPVQWYVLYRLDKEMAALSGDEGIPYNENFILWLLLTFLCSIGVWVGLWQLTGAYNGIWDKRAADAK